MRDVKELDGLQLLKVDTVAELLDVNARSVRRAIKDGRLPGVRFGGSVRVPLAAVRAVVAGTTNGTTKAVAPSPAKPAPSIVEAIQETPERPAREEDVWTVLG